MEELENLRAGWRKLCSCGFTASELAERWHRLRSCGFTASELAGAWEPCSYGITAGDWLRATNASVPHCQRRTTHEHDQ